MAIGATLVSGGSSRNATARTSGSFTPNPNSLYLVAVCNFGGTSAVPTISTTNGLNLVQVGSTLSYFGTTNYVRLYRGLKASGLSAGTITADFGATQLRLYIVIIEITGQDTTGTDGSGAVVQNAPASGTATSGAVSLSAFGDATNNAALAVWCRRVAEQATPEAGWTELFDDFPGDNAGIEVAWRLGADTTPTAAWTNSAAWGGFAVEIKALATAVTYNDTPSGGLVLGGSVVQGKVYDNTPSGGIVLGGSVAQDVTKASTLSGGIVLGGSAVSSVFKGYSSAPSGGIVLGGSVAQDVTRASTLSGGIVLGGSASLNLVRASTPSGGIVLNGSCSSSVGGNVIYTENPVGGIVLGGTAVPTQFVTILPVSDRSDGGWTDQAGGTNLWTAIDEIAAADADYIKSTTSPAPADICEVVLAGAVDPLSSTGHVLSYRYGSNLDGFVTVAQTLTGAQADAITNYGALSIKFEAK